MTPDQVHELARQADEWAEAELLRRFPGHVFSRLSRHFITIRNERFAELVRAEERERMAALERSRYELAHAIWHALDDSCEGDGTGDVTIMQRDYDRLCALVPEDHETLHAMFDPHVDAAIREGK